MIAMSPQGPVELPRIVIAFAAGRPIRAVWKNEVGGLTFQVGVEDARQFVKCRRGRAWELDRNDRPARTNGG